MAIHGPTCFVCFSVVVIGAVLLRKHRWARGGCVGMIVGFQLYFGLVGQTSWPFFHWHLYAFEQGSEIRFFELRVCDNAGREIKLDARAAPPTLATPLNRLAGLLPHLSDSNRAPIVKFLIESANSYRSDVEGGGQDRWSAKFPRHQLGYEWRPELLENIGSFEKIRVYRIDLKTSPDGTKILRRAEIQVGQYS